jgi:hypothetical protein
VQVLEEHGDTIDLAYVGRSLQRLTVEVASLRGDVHVLTAIVQRLDNSYSRLLDEVRATHPHIVRPANRVRELETR